MGGIVVNVVKSYRHCRGGCIHILSRFIPVALLGSLCISNAAADVEIGGGLTLVGLGASGLPATAGDTGISYSVDLELEGEVGDGTVFVYLNTSEGTDVYEGANADFEGGPAEEGGFSSTGIAEAWYQMPFMGSGNLTFGKIDPTGIYDGNEVANDQTTQFLAGVFVNNASIPFPAFTFGLNYGMEIGDGLNFNVGLFEAEGLDGTLERTFVAAEVSTMMELMGGDTNIRLTYWQVDWENDLDGDPSTTADNYAGSDSGYALNLDHNMEPLMLFLRYGTASVADNSPTELESAMSAGLSYDLDDGMLVGLAYSQETAVDPAMADARTWMEAYVSLELDEDLTVSVDYQGISAPDFDATAEGVTIYGVRVQVGF